MSSKAPSKSKTSTKEQTSAKARKWVFRLPEYRSAIEGVGAHSDGSQEDDRHGVQRAGGAPRRGQRRSSRRFRKGTR